MGPLSELADTQQVMLDLVQLGLDIGGVFDPTPITDGASAALSVARLQLTDAAINVVSMVPWLGDASKLLKIPKYIGTLGAIGRLVVHHPTLAIAAAPIIERIYYVTSRIDWEKLPDKWRGAFENLHEEARKALSQVRKKKDELTSSEAMWIQPGTWRGPASSRGTWLGQEGNSAFKLNDATADAFSVPRGTQVKFVAGVPDYSPFVKPTPAGTSGVFDVSGLTGFHAGSAHLFRP